MPRPSETNVSETSLTFKCLGHTTREDGLIGRYHLKVTDTRSGITATISVEPRHLASARRMKRILLDRCMFYTATRASHDNTTRCYSTFLIRSLEKLKISLACRAFSSIMSFLFASPITESKDLNGA
ncbi:hypothetical protein BOO94_30275 [Pseudomonas sp. FSL W5-0299]|nr:hypothetical protein BOO94_30275 [Pseudomonas sp. FSL W5-0299]